MIKAKIYFSFISGITLLGLPAEVYLHGVQYVYVSIGVLLMGFIMSKFYLPVFYGLRITSSYEVSNKINLYCAYAKLVTSKSYNLPRNQLKICMIISLNLSLVVCLVTFY